MEEEARPDRPPKIVHYDRVRRFVQKESMEKPLWVTDAIAAFLRLAATSLQTEKETPQISDVTEQTNVTVCCLFCKHLRIDKHDIIHVFNFELRCHLCHVSNYVGGAMEVRGG